MDKELKEGDIVVKWECGGAEFGVMSTPGFTLGRVQSVGPKMLKVNRAFGNADRDLEFERLCQNWSREKVERASPALVERLMAVYREFRKEEDALKTAEDEAKVRMSALLAKAKKEAGG